MMMEGGQSQIIFHEGTASRWTAMHEWMHRTLQLRNGGPMVGEDAFIESFLGRHQALFGIETPLGAPFAVVSRRTLVPSTVSVRPPGSRSRIQTSASWVKEVECWARSTL